MTLNRITHDVQQGTGAWLRLREGFDTASEAPAALGVGKYVTRTQLLRRKFTGVAEEHSPATLGKFAAGHAAEALARPIAEDVAGGDLYPVTMSLEIAGLRLLASLDGLTLDGTTAWETKLWNEELAADVRAGTLPEHYTVQMDQELLVSGAMRCLFSCTDGTPERFVSCWYEPDPSRFDALVDGWLRFHLDLQAFDPATAADPAPVGKTPDTLPALRIEVTGAVTASNLAEFKATALGAIRAVNRTLKTDQDFADAEKAVKWCADVESRLKAAKEHALSQTADIDALFKALDDIGAEARTVRLDLDKLVARRKTEVKEEAIATARRALDAHIAALNAELAPMRLPTVVADFAGAIKGLKSFASMQDKIDGVLAVAKIAADADARGMRTNLAAFKAAADGFEFLFADLGQIVHKAADDFAAVVQARIAAHKTAEDEKKRKADEAEKASASVVAQAASVPVAAPAAQAYAHQPQRNLLPVNNPSQVAKDEPATLKLGVICERLGVTMTAAFLADVLHVRPAKTEGASKLYTEGQFRTICRQLVSHVGAMAELYAAEVAA